MVYSGSVCHIPAHTSILCIVFLCLVDFTVYILQSCIQGVAYAKVYSGYLIKGTYSCIPCTFTCVLHVYAYVSDFV